MERVRTAVVTGMFSSPRAGGPFDLRPANIKAPLDVRAQVTEYICNSTSALVELIGVSAPILL